MPAVIGICPLIDKKLKSYWMLPAYMQMLQQAGALPVMLPVLPGKKAVCEALDLCDGVLVPGGQDVDPALYGETKSALCGEVSPERDLMDKLVIEEAAARNMPLLGICRGIQILNAVSGGTLYQDLAAECHGSDHAMKPPYDRAAHKVTVLEGTPLADIIGSGEIEVNSYHHQAIKTLSPVLQTSAVSDDGLVEAVWVPGRKFFQAVQWHPELFYQKDEKSRLLIEAFVKATQCK